MNATAPAQAVDRLAPIMRRVTELRGDPHERIWGDIRREAELQVDAEIAAERTARGGV